MTREFDTSWLASPFYNDSHQQWREQVRRFVTQEIEPNVELWEDQGDVPRELYKKAAGVGILGLGYPEKYGGVEEGVDIFHSIVMNEEINRAGAGGVNTALFVHGIALPPIRYFGSDEMKEEVIPPVLAGDKFACLAITEPSGGSDVANLKTKAELDGDH